MEDSTNTPHLNAVSVKLVNSPTPFFSSQEQNLDLSPLLPFNFYVIFALCLIIFVLNI